MEATTNAALSLVFLTLAFVAVFLMFKIWGYPKKEGRSTAPRSLVLIHRLIGACYLILYVAMMWQMVPRLFEYQIEFPARTVAHLMLGVSIGLILIVKLSILRVFKHFGGALPYLGAALLWCTTMVVSLSAPFAFKELIWSGAVAGGAATSDENMERVRRLLPSAGFPPGVALESLVTRTNMSTGRSVLLTKCVGCHDLKTVLTRPRTPANWVRTVGRMAERQIFGQPITDQEQWAVSTYLIAISPELQSSAKRRREQALRGETSKAALATAITSTAAAGEPAGYDEGAARLLFEATCSQCHETSEVESYPFTSASDVSDLLERMIDNGLDASEEELQQIAWFLSQTFVP